VVLACGFFRVNAQYSFLQPHLLTEVGLFYFPQGLSDWQALFLLTIAKEEIMSQEQWEFIQAYQKAQDEAYRIGDPELAISWSEHILEVLNQ